MTDLALVPPDALSGAAVAISVSDSGDLSRLGLTQAHCELAVAELARAIFIAGGTIVYGGRLIPAGFTDLLLDEARRYRGDRDALVLCVPDSEHRKLGDDELRRRCSELHTSAELVLLDAGGAPVGIGDRSPAGPTVDPASALSAMRQHVTNRTTARVLVGGRLRGHQGAAPGILEEAQTSIRASQPLYVAGGFGGAAAALGRALGCDDGAWFPDGYPEGADDHTQLLQELASESGRADQISPGLNASERAQLAASHRPGDIASLVVRGISAAEA